MKMLLMTLFATFLLTAPPPPCAFAFIERNDRSNLDFGPMSGPAQEYEAFQLPAFPGHPFQRTWGINNLGHVTGTSWTCPFILSCLSRAWLYDGQMHDISAEILDSVPAPFIGVTQGWDVNDANQALIRLTVIDVGVFSYFWDDGDVALINGNPDADPGGPLVPIPPPPGATTTTAWAINDSGTVVGTVGIGPPGNTVGHAFLWERGKGVTQLIGPPPGFTSISGLGLNNLGQIVGTVGSPEGSRGYLWTPPSGGGGGGGGGGDGGEFTILPPLPSDLHAQAWHVNDDGYIVGVSTSADFLGSLIIWKDGRIHDFATPPFPPSVHMVPMNMNAQGEAVGYYWPFASSPQSIGFRWSLKSGFEDLNGSVPSLPGFHFWEATGINDSGQIAAWGDFPNFTGGSFILTPVKKKPGIPGDLNGDGNVGVADLLILLAAWGTCDDCAPGTCPADLDGDCDVGVPDLLVLLANWG